MLKYRYAVFAMLVAAVLVAAAPALFAPARRLENNKYGDHIGSYNFTVEIDGVEAGVFVNVDLPEVRRKVIESQVGDTTVTNPGNLGYTPITLERGFFEGSPMKAWADSVRAGNDDRRTVTVILARGGRKAVEVARWNCFGCYPISWRVRAEDAGRGKRALRERLQLGIASFTVTRD